MPIDIDSLTIKTSLVPGNVGGGKVHDTAYIMQLVRLELALEREELLRQMLPKLRDSMTDRLNR